MSNTCNSGIVERERTLQVYARANAIRDADKHTSAGSFMAWMRKKYPDYPEWNVDKSTAQFRVTCQELLDRFEHEELTGAERADLAMLLHMISKHNRVGENPTCEHKTSVQEVRHMIATRRANVLTASTTTYQDRMRRRFPLLAR